MNCRISNCGLALVLLLSAFTFPALGQSTDESLPQLVKRVAPAVVTIRSFQAKGGGNSGSGFFIDQDMIVTNWHVIQGGARFAIQASDGQSYSVTSTVAIDKDNDVAILRVSPKLSAAAALLLSDYLPQVGEHIFVIGTPLGVLKGSVSDGIVSAVRHFRPGTFAIQITAPISPGNSGSPVINMSGHVIGIATFRVASEQNLNFAVGGGAIERALRRVNVTLPRSSFFEFVTEPTANWTLVAVGGLVNYEYDPDSAERKSNGRVSAWLRISPHNDGRVDGKAWKQRAQQLIKGGYSVLGYDRWSHTLAFYEFDCSDSSFIILEMEDYDDAGKKLNSLGSDPRGWMETSPNTVNRKIVDAICR
ncbi:MAG TPA: S1C family serine protease [Pyrinomonadaceae bacterium]|nr:S1C family serine protease [Pyrinomonadaceae bacterium]